MGGYLKPGPLHMHWVAVAKTYLGSRIDTLKLYAILGFRVHGADSAY